MWLCSHSFLATGWVSEHCFDSEQAFDSLDFDFPSSSDESIPPLVSEFASSSENRGIYLNLWSFFSGLIDYFKINSTYFKTFTIQSKMSVDYRDGTLLDQCCRLNNVVLFDFWQLESRLSQTLSEEVKNCHKAGSNSRR